MFELPKLDYELNELQPTFTSSLMELHYAKHHQTYIDKLNSALEKYPEYYKKPVEYLVKNYRELPDEIQTPVRNFAGGHYNHSLFWRYLSPNSSDAPTGQLADTIVEKFGSFDDFKAQFSQKAVSLFGSGWTWLLDDMTIINTPNQDNPISDGDAKPLLCIDVWEHAYYFDYTYRRADYVSGFWKIVNWDKISADYEKQNS